MHRYIYLAIMVVVVCAITGCGPDQAIRLAAQGDTTPQRSDNVPPSVRHAGLSAMQARVKRAVDGYSKIESNAQLRYFMHPTMEKDSLIEFNVAGLTELTLSPRIGDLDSTCSKDPQAGQVVLAYAVDTNVPTRVVIDRSYDRLIPIALHGAQSLTVSVNHGNGVVTCDWFGLGVVNVK